MYKLIVVFTASIFAFGTVSWLYFRRKRSKIIIKPRMKLYWFDNFRSKRVEWLIAELGAMNDIEMVELNPRDPNAEKLASYRRLQPHGTVPCLEVQGRPPIIESGAICLYLAHVYQQLGPPDTDLEAFYSWLVYSVATLDELMEVLFVQWIFTELEERDNEVIDKMVLKFDSFASYISQHLQTREYICGNRLTAVDCVIGYNLWWANAMRDGVLLRKFPVLLDYYSRLQRRSAFQRVFTD